jgi:hypothetical protein
MINLQFHPGLVSRPDLRAPPAGIGGFPTHRAALRDVLLHVRGVEHEGFDSAGSGRSILARRFLVLSQPLQVVASCFMGHPRRSSR